MVNKIFKTGHSAAVTLSPKILEEMGLKIGDVVKIEITANKENLIVSKGSSKKQLPLDFKLRPRLKN